VLLLTGATSPVGRALLRRLTAAREPVRCLVRDPRRLGSDRVRVQIALGDLADPPSFRNALRGVHTVVHLAAAIRDQPAGSIEELNGIATWRMVQAAERAGVEHFVFMSSLGAASHDRTRFLRAKALAERAVLGSDIRRTVVAPSLIYAPGDMLTTLLERIAALSPVVPLSGSGRARFAPIWADDVGAAIAAILSGAGDGRDRYELAGPDVLSQRAVAELVLRAAGRTRRLVNVPAPVVSRCLRIVEMLLTTRAPLTWDEAELLEVSMVAARGTADAESLGVQPHAMQAILAA
jgi:NADH dehydrogenase